MLVQFYLLFVWLSGSIYAFIGHDELEASTAAFGSKSPGRNSWGSDLTLGPENCPKCSLVTKDPPHANLFHELRSDGPTAEAPLMDLALRLGRNEATYPPRDDIVVHDRVSSKREMSGKGKAKVFNDDLDKQIPFDIGMEENGMVTTLDRHIKIGRQGSFESESFRKLAEEKGFIKNSVTPAHRESEARKESFSMDEIKNYLNERYTRWFDPTVGIPSHYDKYFFVFVLHELFGREIISKIEAKPRRLTFEYPLKFNKLRRTCQSQTLRAIVSFIHLINEISYPPLYPTLQKLQEAQCNGFFFVESVWEQLEMGGNHQLQQGNADHIIIHSLEEISAIKHMISSRNFSFRQSVQLSNLMFLMWTKKYHKMIYEQVHAQENPLKWKPWLISCLNDKLLSSKSAKEIEDEIIHGVDEHFPDYYKTQTFITYQVINPLKINWKKTEGTM